MGSITSYLILSIEALENGSFEKALQNADQVIQSSKNNFWGWYLGAISLAFLKDESSFLFYLERAENILPHSIYCKYLKIYLDILKDNESNAIIELTKLVDDKNGWFAHELLEKIRLGDKLKEYARKGDIGKFVLIPNLKKEILKMKKNQKLTFPKQPPKWWLFILLLFFSLVSIVFLAHHLKIFEETNLQENQEKVMIPTKVGLLKNLPTRKFLHQYTNSQKVINDFKRAKELLKLGKVNQSRYLLRRMAHSNADFSTREKSKIFMGFIPQVFFEEFDDPIKPSQITKEPKLYEGAQILWEGVIQSKRIQGTGNLLKIMVHEKKQKFIIDAFILSKQLDNKIESYNNYTAPNKQTDSLSKKNIVIFGRFKGLIGGDKRIYIELDRLWI